MRGIRRGEQTTIVAAFRNQMGIDGSSVPTSSAHMTASEALSTVVSMATDGLADTSMRRLERLVKKL